MAKLCTTGRISTGQYLPHLHLLFWIEQCSECLPCAGLGGLCGPHLVCGHLSNPAPLQQPVGLGYTWDIVAADPYLPLPPCNICYIATFICYIANITSSNYVTLTTYVNVSNNHHQKIFIYYKLIVPD